VLVRVNPAYYRPRSAHPRVGDATLIGREIGWRPATTIDGLCRMMVDADLARLSVPARA
jgi:GDPmannose 4,6-dehydratase